MLSESAKQVTLAERQAMLTPTAERQIRLTLGGEC